MITEFSTAHVHYEGPRAKLEFVDGEPAGSQVVLKK